MAERAITSIETAQGVKKQFLTPCSSCDFDPSDCRYQFKAGSKSPVMCDLNEGAPVTIDVVERFPHMREYTVVQAPAAVFPVVRLKQISGSFR